MKTVIVALLCLTASLTAATARAAAKPGVEYLKTVSANGMTFQVATFTQNGITVGVLGIKGPGDPKAVSFSTKKGPWGQFASFWDQAVKTDAKQWTFIGALTEEPSARPCHIVVYAGPQLKVSIVDPSRGVLQFVVPDDQKEDLGKAIHDAEAVAVDGAD